MIDKFTREPAVTIAFDDVGTAQLAELTSANVNMPMAVGLDGVVQSTPVIREPITTGQIMLSGGFTEDSARQLAIALLSGALPATFKLVEASPTE